MYNLGVHVVDEVGIVGLAEHQGKGVDHLHELAVCLVGCSACRLHGTYGQSHTVFGALQSERADTLVGFFKIGDECREREGSDLRGELRLKVGYEIDEQTCLLVELVCSADTVVFDVLCEFLCRLRHVGNWHCLESLHGFLVACIEGVTVAVCLGYFVSQQALLRNLQSLVLCRHGFLQSRHEFCGLCLYFAVRLGTGKYVANESEVCAVVHARKADVLYLFHCLTDLSLYYCLAADSCSAICAQI